jgi:hypothetical protein
LILKRMSALERKRIGMRLFAILSAQRKALKYKRLGINPCEAATAAHVRNAARRREEKRLAALGAPPESRSKIIS